ncbi:UMP-CMP kinase [Dispira parvispora]|uniref:UMP-CMP kinase n=1 Tax=Dispira parvispora TaxID=1520584 RepID=A0A9W8ARE1_9FUNG|nr:UMP-CMP kinase [Dispira parvispora]
MEPPSSPSLVPFRLENDLAALSLSGFPTDATHLSQTPFIVGITGGRFSGKTCMVDVLRQEIGRQPLLQDRHVLALDQDDFYRELGEAERELAQQGKLNMDHPDAFDFDHLEQVLEALKAGESVTLPRWDPENCCRTAGATVTSKPDVVLLTGVLLLYKRRVRQLLSLMVFVDIDSDTRLSRQVVALMNRSEHQESTSLSAMLHHYTFIAKPSFEEFIQPTKRWADIIVPKGRENAVAINMILQHLNELFKPTTR